MAAIPLSAVPVVRAALVGQGFPARAIQDNGDIDPVALLTGFYDTIEFRTNIVPSVRLRIEDLAGDGQPSIWARMVKPSVTFSGQSGVVRIAPHGTPHEATGAMVSVLFIASLVGLGYMLGKTGRR